ncbi:MAG: CoA transferase, partial [Flavobacteriales bacterium]
MFSDLRVLDLSSVLAGPAVATFFAELGAQVTKIEHPVSGDVTRSWKNNEEPADAPISAYYASVNYGKHVMRLNLGEISSRPTLESMIAHSDIIVTNFKSGDAEKFNLTSEVLFQINPQIIHAKISGF